MPGSRPLSVATEAYQEPLFTLAGLADAAHTLTVRATKPGAGHELDAIAVTGIAPGIPNDEDAAEYEGAEPNGPTLRPNLARVRLTCTARVRVSDMQAP